MNIPSSLFTSPGMKLIFSRIFPWPFILMGAGILFFGGRELVRARESTSWPVAKGIIQNSSVQDQSGDDGGRTHHAEIRYEYTIHGVIHGGSRVAYGDYGSSDSSHAQQIVNRYPKGKEISVYYLPSNHKECLLEPGITLQAWFMPGAGFLFFSVGILMAIFLPKAMAKMGRPSEPQDGVNEKLYG